MPAAAAILRGGSVIGHDQALSTARSYKKFSEKFTNTTIIDENTLLIEIY